MGPLPAPATGSARAFSSGVGSSLEERFWEKVDKNGPIPPSRPDLGPCWIWRASICGVGYGHLGVDGKTRDAHRISYLLLTGPIPEGYEIDHLCRVRPCVNPAHLEAVTSAENNRRAMAVRVAARTHCPHGHPYDAENTIHRKNGARGCRACGRLATKQYMQQRRAMERA